MSAGHTSRPASITIFATPKKFDGHIGVIQRNAITSWTHIQPKPEVILFGTEPGTAELAAELGLRHEERGILKVLPSSQHPSLADTGRRKTVE